MSALAHRSALGDGGIAARRAVVRWATRMFRREWRQQLLVVTLLTVAVAAAIGSITVAYNSIRADNSQFGSAHQILTFDASNPQVEQGLAAARRSFGTIDVVGHRPVPVPGSVDNLDYRSETPGGTYTGGLLALRRGAYPKTAGEVAVTDGVASSLRLEIGSTLALDGRRRTVVGIVENPRKLSDEFALVTPSSANAQSLDVFVGPGDGSPATPSFFAALGERNEARWGFSGTMMLGNDVSSTGETLAMFSVATVFLFLASLVAAAGFAVVAQRRLRQLGMLAAVGGTQKHIRLVLVTNGAVVGAIAAVLGTIAGLGLWLAVAPLLEPAVDHRIDRLSLPWGLIVLTGVLALAGATAAAWWPGRTIARLPVVLALSGRPPRPRPARHSALAAGALFAVGIGCLALSGRDKPLLIIAGLVATILATLLLGPLAIRTFSAVAGHVTVAPRLALRDLARYQARSGAALAAVTLALGIAATVVVTASAEEAKQAKEPPSLTNRQIRVHMGRELGPKVIPVEQPRDVARQAAAVRKLAAGLGDATVVPLSKVVQPGMAPIVQDNTRFLPTVELTRQFTSSSGEKSYRAEAELYVATPALLSYLGIDPGSISPATDYLLAGDVNPGELVVPSLTSRRDFPVRNVQRIQSPQQRHLGAGSGPYPPYFITLDGIRRHGWKQIRAGWLVNASKPLTTAQIADARDRAAAAGATIEVRDKPNSQAKVMAIATAAGALLALAILAMTTGLIRGESAGDLKTLTAAGATPRIRRTLTATTAGALAFLGALLGIAGAYIALAATYHDDLDYLSNVPTLYLALALVGVPLAAAAAGWLLAGREPPVIAKPVIE